MNFEIRFDSKIHNSNDLKGEKIFEKFDKNQFEICSITFDSTSIFLLFAFYKYLFKDALLLYCLFSNIQESTVKMSISIIFLDLHSSEIFIQGLDLQLVDAINPKGLPLNKNCNSSLTFDFLCSTSIRLAVNQLKRKERKKMIAHSIVTSPLVKLTLYK